MSEGKQSKNLRRVINPYAGIVLILSVVTIGLLTISARSRQWGLMYSVAIGWIGFLYLLYVGLKYKISWGHGVIRQEASGGEPVAIAFSDISAIKLESGKGAELLRAARPFRRLSIYSNEADGERFIDVSLKHFAASDIRELVRAINKDRPELSVPKQWL